ncbi:acetyltransferase [Rhizobium sp. R693]|nr:acetyltransferase [Rhizobium sp. R693]
MVVSELKVRKMTVADHHMVGEVGFTAWKSSGAKEVGFHQAHVIEHARKAFFDYPAAAKGDVAVAELEGRIVGWGGRENEPNHISDIWIDPACQGRGSGSALIRYFIERIAADGFKVAKIDTRATNAGAIRLYERAGFSIIWRDEKFDAALGIPLEKVHLEKRLG